MTSNNKNAQNVDNDCQCYTLKYDCVNNKKDASLCDNEDIGEALEKRKCLSCDKKSEISQQDSHIICLDDEDLGIFKENDGDKNHKTRDCQWKNDYIVKHETTGSSKNKYNMLPDCDSKNNCLHSEVAGNTNNNSSTSSQPIKIVQLTNMPSSSSQSDRSQTSKGVYHFCRRVRVPPVIVTPTQPTRKSSKLVQFAQQHNSLISHFLNKHHLTSSRRPCVSARCSPQQLLADHPHLYRRAECRARLKQRELDALLVYVCREFGTHLAGTEDVLALVQRAEDLTDFIVKRYVQQYQEKHGCANDIVL